MVVGQVRPRSASLVTDWFAARTRKKSDRAPQILGVAVLSEVDWFRDEVPDLSRMDVAMAGLQGLVEALENGTVVTQDGVDVTAAQLAQLKQMLAYLDAVLFRLSHSEN